MIITDFSQVSDQGSIVIFEGTDEATGDHVTFGVDHRPAAEILELGDEVQTLYVEDWQVLSRTPAKTQSIVDEHFERYQQNGTWCGD